MNKKLLTLLPCLLIASCSSKQTSLVKNAKQKPVAKVKPLIFGPTQSSTSFVDKTWEYGLGNLKAVHLYAIDFDADGDTDLITLPDFYSVPKFFQFDSKEKKFKKLDYNPIPSGTRGSFLTFVDLNRDGLKDIIVGTLNQKTELTKRPLRVLLAYKVTRFIHYKEVPTPFTNKYVSPVSSIALLDYNLDGHLDIYEGNWFDVSKKTKIVPDRFFTGNKLNYTLSSNLLTDEYKYEKSIKSYVNARPTFALSTCDLDQNGYPDIMTSSSSGHTNKLWMNVLSNKKRIFRDYSKVSGYAQDENSSFDPKSGGNSLFSSCTDYNNDGIMDIFMGELTHSYDNEDKDVSSVLSGATLTFPPKYLRSPFIHDESDVWSQADRRAIWADFNNDGLIDLVTENSGFPPMTRLVVFIQNKDHSFDNQAKSLGMDLMNPSGSVIIDVNNDGRLDLITGQTSIRNSKIKPRIYLFENNLKQTNRSITLHLCAKKSNPDAFGTLVKLKGQTIQTRWFNPLEGSLPSQNPNFVHFGVGAGESPHSLEVTWPVLGKYNKPLKRSYNLKNMKISAATNLSVYENGRIKKGKHCH